MDRLKDQLPDIPRWVEARDLVLSGQGEVFGLAPDGPLSLALRNPEEDVTFVIGRPDPSAVRAAVGSGDLIAGIEARDWLVDLLPEWNCEAAPVFTLARPALPAPSPAVRMVSLEDIISSVDDADLLEELQAAAAFTEIAASFEDGRPVSFCYASAETETLWDVGIDTLEAYQRRGHAAQVAAFMIRRMKARGLDVVWTALESNVASLKLAASLGFQEVDRILIFQRAEESLRTQ